LQSAPPTSRGIFLDHTQFFYAGKIARRGDALYLGLSRGPLCGEPSVLWVIWGQRHLEQSTLPGGQRTFAVAGPEVRDLNNTLDTCARLFGCLFDVPMHG
jgi:hypothetical protein